MKGINPGEEPSFGLEAPKKPGQSSQTWEDWKASREARKRRIASATMKEMSLAD